MITEQRMEQRLLRVGGDQVRWSGGQHARQHRRCDRSDCSQAREVSAGCAKGHAGLLAKRVSSSGILACPVAAFSYGLVTNNGFIASAKLYPTMQYTLALP